MGTGNETACSPMSADGNCGVDSFGSVVPATGACVINQPPRFVSDGTVALSPTRSIFDTPGLLEYEKNRLLGNVGALDGDYELPVVQGYYGKEVAFAVTAQDDDDCSELLVESTILPDGAYLEDPEYLVSYDSFPNGQKVRKKLRWPAQGDASSDTRAAKSKACFYAFDKYLVTSTPFYCVEIHLMQEPSTEDEILMRFDCKLSLRWNELLGRFVVSDEINKFYSSKSYEGYMWHHAAVAIDEKGKGSLYVDGAVAELDLNVGTNVDDVATFNNGTAIGTEFSTVSYPNKCVSTESTSSRRLQAFSVGSLQRELGFQNTEDLGINPPTGDCCTFRVAEDCSSLNDTTSFEGFADEVAVWNRRLSADEVAALLFDMPARRSKSGAIPDQETRAQFDVTAGRVLWARFNSPCREGKVGNNNQHSGASDLSGLTSGSLEGGLPNVTDDADDTITFSKYTTSAKYVFTGVPWLAPYLRSAESQAHLPLDGGGQITATGVGFARSPFLKCVGSHSKSGGESRRVASAGGPYAAMAAAAAGTEVLGDSAESEPPVLARVSATGATTASQYDPHRPHLFLSSLSHPSKPTSARSDAWAADKRVPVFEENRSGSTLEGQSIHGFWETVTCDAPPASFPTDRYELGVSNDAGVSLANTRTKVYTEHALELDGSVALIADTKVVGATYTLWFQITQPTLTFATLLELSNGLGFTYEDEVVHAVYGNSKLGSLGGKTSLNEWHHLSIAVDEGQTRMLLDAQVVVDVAMPNLAGGYALQSVGNNLKGVLDEFRVYSSALTTEEIVRGAFRRELDLSRMSAYYRFNQDFLDYTRNTTLSVLGKSNAKFVSVGAPWEPTTVYSANGARSPEVSEGSDAIAIEGFNFARSKWLTCKFGESGLDFAYSGIGRNGGDLSRPDGVQQSIDGSEVFVVSGSETPATYVSITEATCEGAPAEPRQARRALLDLGVGETTVGLPGDESDAIDGPLSLQVRESALQCDGLDDSATAVGVASGLSGSASGYTISLFARPAEGATSAAESVAVISVESSDGKKVYHRIELHSTGVWAYYDNFIGHVASGNATSGSWSHLQIEIEETGRGYFTVDGTTSQFDTRSRAAADASVRLCTSHSESASHFHGLVDDLLIASTALSPQDTLQVHYSGQVPAHVTTSGEVVAYFEIGHASTGDLLESTSHAADVAPTLVLSGAKVEPSQWFWSPGSSATSGNGGEISGLQAGLLAHYPMDAVRGETNATGTVIFDIVGGRSGFVAGNRAVADRNGVLKGAMLAEGLQIAAPAAYIEDGDFTLCAWAKIADVARAKPHAAAGAPDVFLAWKLLCATGSASPNGEVKLRDVYVNYATATEAQAQAVGPLLEELASAGTVTTYRVELDDLWVYGRALTGQEIASRFFTSHASLRVGASDEVAFELAGSAALAFEGLSVWIRLDGDVAGPRTVAAAEDGSWAVGVEGGGVFLSVAEQCDCTGRCHLKHLTSARPVRANTWHHVAASYTGGKATFMVDGILVEEHDFSSENPSPPTPKLGRVLVGRSPASEVDAASDALEGEIFSLSLTKAEALLPWLQRSLAWCPPLDLEYNATGIAHFELNELVPSASQGGGLRGHTSVEGSSALVSSSTPLRWSNASHDGYGDFGYSRVNLEGADQWLSGDTVFFSISTHDPCGSLRASGGEIFTVTFQRLGQSTVLSAEVRDTNDGNYHVVMPGLGCGTYKVLIASASGFNEDAQVIVGARQVSASQSEVTSVPADQCFGVPFRMELSAFDEYGCPSVDGGASFEVKLRGPHDADAAVTHVGGNVYAAEFVPLAPGRYFAEISLQGTPLAKTPHQCVEVCYGGSLSVDGESGVEVAESALAKAEDGTTELDMAGEASGTIKAWVNPSGVTDTDAYVVAKQSASSAKRGDFAKGYHMKLSGDYKTLEGAVYSGMGRVGNVTANTTIGLNAWTHLAFTFKGEDLKLFVDGEVVSETSVEWGDISVYPNPYDTPVSVGQGFVGKIDEVTVLASAQAPALVKEQIWCPPVGGSYDDVVLYLPFNGYAGVNSTGATPGYSRKCVLSGAGQDCLQGIIFGSAALDPLSSPLNALSPGVGTPGSTHSVSASPPYAFSSSFNSIRTEFDILARDQCGFAYQKGESGAFGITIERLDVDYDTDEAVGTNHPVTRLGEAQQIFATLKGSEVSTCYSGTTQAPYVSGDVYTQSMSVDTAGDYQVTVFANSTHGVAAAAPFVASAKSLIPHSILVLDSGKEFEAGFASTLRIRVQDSAGNAISSPDLDLDFELTLHGAASSSSAEVNLVLDEETSTYLLRFELQPCAKPAGYNLLFLHRGTLVPSDVYPLLLQVSHSGVVRLATDARDFGDLGEPCRVGHTSASHRGDLFVFGGADAKSGAYAADTIVLRGAEDAATSGYLYEKEVVLKGLAGADWGADPYLAAAVLVDTSELLGAGRILPGCEDIAFAMGESPLDFFMDPHPGCGRNDTTFYVRVDRSMMPPASESADVAVRMIYGNPSMAGGQRSDHSRPKRVFAVYEDFEDGTAGALVGISQCGAAGAFAVTDAHAKHGGRSLLANSSAGGGVAVAAVAPLESFHLKAWLWDSLGSQSENYVSPDQDYLCDATGTSQPLGEQPPLPHPAEAVGIGHWIYAGYGSAVSSQLAEESSNLESPAEATGRGVWVYDVDGRRHFISIGSGAVSSQLAEESSAFVELVPEVSAISKGQASPDSTAVGVFTGSHGAKVVAGYPWEATSAPRAAGWKLLEVVSDAAGTRVLVDGKVEKSSARRTTLDKVLLKSGGGGEGSDAMWDTVSVRRLPTSEDLLAVVAVAGPMTLDRRSLSTADHRPSAPFPKSAVWERVPTAASPPARFGHSSVTHEGTKYVFGGERNARLQNDLWAFDLAAEEWRHVLPGGAKLPEARVGHSAVAVGGKMVVLGGRGASGHPLKDAWEFDFEDESWELVANTTAAGARMGHTATLVAGSVYVLGGEGPGAESAVFLRCDEGDATGSCVDVTHGCPESPSTSKVLADFGLAGGISGHAAEGKGGQLFVLGGSDPRTGELSPGGASGGGVYSFDADACSWEAAFAGPDSDFAAEGHSASMGDEGLMVFGGRGPIGFGCTRAFLGPRAVHAA